MRLFQKASTAHPEQKQNNLITLNLKAVSAVCIDIEAHLDGWKFMNKKSKAKGAQDGAPADETMGLMPQQTPDKREGMTQAE